ncbi:MAG TPA: phosphatase PAP2 family protein [Tepidisphaeraceae bacterium]|nr:phosphatase PAP2 family protein [Tepidisphaeraceae bacterium]
MESPSSHPQEHKRASWLWPALFFILWFLTLLIAFKLDQRIARWVQHESPLGNVGNLGRRLLRLPGYFPFTLVICIALGLLHPRRWIGALSLFACGAAGGLAYSILKWIIGRHRPKLEIAPFSLHPFAGGVVGLFHAEKGLSFPSGDATLAFATAACLSLLLPRAWLFFYLAALVVAAERVLENAHYLSDVVAGAGIGILIGHFLTRWFLMNFPTQRANIDRGLPRS